MPTVSNLMGAGYSGGAAQAIVGIPRFNLVATGTDLASALTAPSDVMVFSTVDSGTGVRLPAWNASNGPNQADEYKIINLGANSLNVYPGTLAGTINGNPAGTPIAVGANKVLRVFYIGVDVQDKWAAILSA